MEREQPLLKRQTAMLFFFVSLVHLILNHQRAEQLIYRINFQNAMEPYCPPHSLCGRDNRQTFTGGTFSVIESFTCCL